MEKSKQSQEILELGKKIVQEFSEHDRCDATTRWMSHYLAELIEKSETEQSSTKKKLLQKEAAEIILDLWRRRKDFPGSAKPLFRLEKCLAIIDALKDNPEDILSWRRFIEYENLTPWGNFMKTVRTTTDDILAISLSAAIIPNSLLKEKEWLEHSKYLTESEKQIIKNLDSLLNKSDSLIKIVIAGSTEDDEEKVSAKIDAIFDKMEALIEKQKKKLASLKQNVHESIKDAQIMTHKKPSGRNTGQKK